MSRALITLTSDFGPNGAYVASMKGVILSINPDAQIVDLTHAIPPQDVRHGAFVLTEATRWYPSGTIHVAVVDPGVGTSRPIVCARLDDQTFVAPDNGLLELVARRCASSAIYEVREPHYQLPEVSATFHGRDIMAPAAAHLSRGLDPAQLGPPCNRLKRLAWPEPECAPQRVAGEVVLVDSFGNLMTNIDREHLRDAEGASVRVACAGQTIEGLVETYGNSESGHLVALIGSSGALEIACVNGSAAAQLRAGPGAQMTVEWDATAAD